MRPVHILVDEVSPRLEYVCWQIFPRMLGWSFKLTADREQFVRADTACIDYTKSGPIREAFRITPSGLLRKGERINKPTTIDKGPFPVIFPEEGDLPFDLFSAVFYLLSRMEEYVHLPKDEHGRPQSEGLWMVRNGAIERPLVEEWVHHFADRFRRRSPQLPVPQREFKVVTSVDIDNGFMYLGRSWWRTVGSMLRDVLRGDTYKVEERIAVLKGDRSDPYDVYDRFMENIKEAPGRKMVFALVGERTKHDHAVGLRCAKFVDRLQQLKDQVEIGVHPSYPSSRKLDLIQRERSALSNTIDREVMTSRQHFLRFTLPDTYRQLEAIGIKEDHSMGLADHVGFRAGTCTPFYWYDLEQERQSKLEVWPMTTMDSTFRYKMKLSPEEALKKIQSMIEKVRAVGGTFSSLWHERFLSGHGPEKGWRQVFERTMEELRG